MKKLSRLGLAGMAMLAGFNATGTATATRVTPLALRCRMPTRRRCWKI